MKWGVCGRGNQWHSQQLSTFIPPLGGATDKTFVHNNFLSISAFLYFVETFLFLCLKNFLSLSTSLLGLLAQSLQCIEEDVRNVIGLRNESGERTKTGMKIKPINYFEFNLLYEFNDKLISQLN